MKLDPHDTWIFYQALVTLGTLIIAGANVVSAVYIVRFVKKATSIMRNIERNTRVVRTDVLLKRAAHARSQAEGRRLRATVAEEDEMKG